MRHHLARLSIATIICACGFSSARAQENTYPTFTSEQLIAGLFDADCDPFTVSTSSEKIAESNGFAGYPVRLCLNETGVTDLVFWTKTMDEGASKFVNITTMLGQKLPVAGVTKNEATNEISFSLNVTFNDEPKICYVRQPDGEDAVLGEIFCK